MIEKAFDIWIKTLNDVNKLLFTHPKEWRAGIWDVINSINASLTVVAVALLVLFFYIGMTQKGINLKELRQPEVAFGLFVRLVVSVGIVGAAMPITTTMFEVIQGVMEKIAASSVKGEFTGKVPPEIVKAIDDASIFSFGGDNSIVVGLLGVFLVLVIFVLSIVLLVIVWGRFLNLYVHFAVSGLFLSGFAAESTQFLGVGFLKSFANAAFQGVIIMLAMIIYSYLITTDNSAAIEAAVAGDSSQAILLYSKDFLVGALVMLSLCKGADRIADKMGL